MPTFLARVRVLVEIPLEAEAPSLEHEPVRDGERAGLRAMNEEAVLKARRKAAKDAERAAKEAFPDAIEMQVEEVVER